MDQEIPAAAIAEDEKWEETRTSLFLRALFTLLAGGYLSWAQWNSGIADAGAQWGRWVWLSVWANLLLPLGIVWLFYAQSLYQNPWLKSQASNAWSYGFELGEAEFRYRLGGAAGTVRLPWPDFTHFVTHLKWAAGMTLAMLPLLFLASRAPEAKAAYAGYIAHLYNGPVAAASFFALLIVYMFCWEWFHRGFLLFGIAQWTGPVPAIVLQAVLFGLAHAGKPAPEQYGAFAGGLILGAIAWRQKSFATPFYTHAMIHIAWILMLLF